jgi:hypothetical protein
LSKSAYLYAATAIVSLWPLGQPRNDKQLNDEPALNFSSQRFPSAYPRGNPPGS